MFYQFIPSKYCSMQLTHNFWKVSKMSNIHRTNIKVPGCIKNANLSRLTLGKYWKLRHNVLLLNSIIHKIFANTSLMPVRRFLQHLAKIQFLTMQIMTKPSAFLPTVKHMALKDKHHYSWWRMTEIQAIINTSVAVCSIIFYVLSLLTGGSQLQIYLKPPFRPQACCSATIVCEESNKKPPTIIIPWWHKGQWPAFIVDSTDAWEISFQFWSIRQWVCTEVELLNYKLGIQMFTQDFNCTVLPLG